MKVFSFDDFAANHNVVPTDRPDRFKADIDAVRSLLESDALFSWHCMLNDSEDPRNIPAGNPMWKVNYWENGGSDENLICDMSCPSRLGSVLDILPDNVEFMILCLPVYLQNKLTVWILPTYDNIAEMGVDRLTFLCNSAG